MLSPWRNLPGARRSFGNLHGGRPFWKSTARVESPQGGPSPPGVGGPPESLAPSPPLAIRGGDGGISTSSGACGIVSSWWSQWHSSSSSSSVSWAWACPLHSSQSRYLLGSFLVLFGSSCLVSHGSISVSVCVCVCVFKSSSS